MLALKLKALRGANYEKGTKDLADVAGLLRVLDIKDVDAAIAILTEFFPKSAARFQAEWTPVSRPESALT
jgi:hypothetical protein